MKTKILIVSLAVIGLLALAGCSQAAARENLNNAGNMVQAGADRVGEAVEGAVENPAADVVAETAAPTPSYAAPAVTKEEAQGIALSHAGFTADQVNWLHAEYEVDNGIPQFEVDFHQDRWEYEYEIHAETGEILTYDRDD